MGEIQRWEDMAYLREKQGRDEPYLYASTGGRVMYTSQGLNKLLGEDLTGRNLTDFMEDRQAADIIAANLDGESTEIRFRFRERGYRLEAEPWEDGKGSLLLTFYPLVPEAGNDRWTDPEQLLFLSRELNEQLSGLSMNLSLLEDEGLGEKLVGIRRQFCRMLRLSRCVQDSVQAQMKQLLPRYTQEDLVQVLEQLRPTVEQVCQKANIRLVWQMPEEAVVCRVDVELIRRMLGHLLCNAIQAQPNGGQILLTLEQTAQDEIHLTVTDQGRGTIGGLDSTFVRRAPEELHQQKGMGLGLPLIRAYAEAMGGRLMLMRRGGNGLIAKVILPRNMEAELMPLHVRAFHFTYGGGIDQMLVDLSPVAARELYQK